MAASGTIISGRYILWGEVISILVFNVFSYIIIHVS